MTDVQVLPLAGLFVAEGGALAAIGIGDDEEVEVTAVANQVDGLYALIVHDAAVHQWQHLRRRHVVGILFLLAQLEVAWEEQGLEASGETGRGGKHLGQQHLRGDGLGQTVLGVADDALRRTAILGPEDLVHLKAELHRIDELGGIG